MVVQPSRHGIAIVGADHGGGMLREVGHSAGNRVRFVGHTEHASIIDLLVAEHHHATLRQVPSLEPVGYPVLLGGAGFVDRQEPESVFLVTVRRN